MYIKSFKTTNSPKVLYLDQNIWIYLGQIHYGKTINPILSNILKKIKEKVFQNKLIIPINLTNVIETKKNQNKSQSDRLAKFMVSISKGYAFIPFIYLIRLEIENLVRKQLNLPLYNIRNYAIGKGVFYLIHDGGPPELISNQITGEIKNQMKNVLENHFSTEQAVLDFILKDNFKDSNNNELTIQKLEAIRDQGLKMKDKKLKEKIGYAHFFINTIATELYFVCLKYNINPYNLKNWIYKTPKHLLKFLQGLPLLYTSFCLYRGLDRNPEHKIISNDLQDIFSFSFAIPYCDFVAGEKYTISIAKQNKLDDLYGTVLFKKSNFKDIEMYLNAI